MFYKRSITLIVFFLVLYSGSAQRWEEYIGETGRKENSNDVIEYYDKGYLLVGGVENLDKWGGGLVKTDINGQVLWNKEIWHDINELWIKATTQDEEGNIYACGVIVIDEHTWPLIMKLDACGALQWCRAYMNNNHDYGWASDILMTDDNKLVVLTNLRRIGPDIEQIFIMSLDAVGNILWIRPYASKNDYPLIANAGAYNFIQHSNNYFLSGYCYWPFPNDPDHVFLRPFMIGIDSLFNEKWIMPFAPLDSVFGHTYSSYPINDSVIMGVGKRRFNEGTEHLSNSLLMFYNLEGEELGHKQITNSQIGSEINGNFINSVERINDTLFIAAANFGEDDQGNPYGELIIDTAGNVYNHLQHPGTTDEPSIIKTYDDKFILENNTEDGGGETDIFLYKLDENLESVPVYTENYTYDSLCDEPIESGIIDITGCLIVVGTEEIPAPQEYFAKKQQIIITPFPNPATTQITFKLENMENFRDITLSCYDTYGRQLYNCELLNGQQECSVDVSGWNSGAYIAVVKSKDRIVGRSTFVVN